MRRLTATDIAVAGKLCDIGTAGNVKDLKPDLAILKIREMVEEVVDRIKVSNEELPVILVGGGAVLLDSNKTLHGASKVIIPVCADVANAVGATLSQISGTVDKVYSLKDYFDKQQLQFEIEKMEENNSLNLLEKETQENRIRKAYFERAREIVLKDALEIAVSAAVLNGADRKTVNIVEKSDTSLSYIPGNATRIQIKAIGNLHLTSDVVIIHFCFS